MLKKRALLVVSIVLPGCFANVATLEPRAEGIQVVHESDKPLRCDVLGKITGRSRSDNEQEARKGAENDFRNQAAELQANYAFIGGKALRCQTEAMEEAEDKAAAAKREQKEKDDAEREQKDADEKKSQAKAKQHGKK